MLSGWLVASSFLSKKLYEEESSRIFFTKDTFVLSFMNKSLGTTGLSIHKHKKTSKKVSSDPHIFFEKERTMYNLGLCWWGNPKTHGKSFIEEVVQRASLPSTTAASGCKHCLVNCSFLFSFLDYFFFFKSRMLIF